MELKYLSPEGRVFYTVYNSTAVPYEVILDYTRFQAGATPAEVVRGCNCKDWGLQARGCMLSPPAAPQDRGGAVLRHGSSLGSGACEAVGPKSIREVC